MKPKTVEIDTSATATLTAVIYLENNEPRGYFVVQIMGQDRITVKGFNEALMFYTAGQKSLKRLAYKLLEDRVNTPATPVVGRHSGRRTKGE